MSAHCRLSQFPKKMAESKVFDEFEPIFGEAEVEGGAAIGGASRCPFLFYAQPLDSSHLKILASDFHLHAFECVLTVSEIDDLQDETGIGGSWNDFVHYLLASLSSGDVKLIINSPKGLQESGVTHANLVARKSKGLPRVSLPLNRLVNLLAKDAAANISLALYKAYKNKRNDIVEGQENFSRLKEMLSSERERSKNLQMQLDALTFSSKRKATKTKDREKPSHDIDNVGAKEIVVFEADQTSANITSLEKPPARDARPMKGTQRPAPAHRRSKARGVSLQHIEDDDES